MALQEMTENVEIVQTLSDYPNQEEGLSAEELKAKFDQGPKALKEYINDQLVPAVRELERVVDPGMAYGLDATLSVSGRAADAGAVGTALAGKAPAGYGLGGSAVSFNVININDMKSNGWFYTSTAYGYYIGNTPLYYINLRVDSWIDCAGYACATQTIFMETIQVKRTFRDNWGEWEWVNPPMIPGVEYRTTERWNGKAVYVQMLNFGALPNSTAKVMDVSVSGATMVQCIDLGGIFGNASGTTTGALLGLKELTGHSFENSAYGFTLGLITNGDVSAVNAYPVVKYTKD